jgi:chromosome segregation ATPase
MDQGDLDNMNERPQEKNNELTVFEEIRRDLVFKKDLNIPMAYVFGRGLVGNKESFGGRSLQENTQKVDQALANVDELQNVWNHSHSQWTWRHLNLSYHAPYKNMRQIAAEVSSKKAALNEAKWRHVENEVKLRKYEDELLHGQEQNDLGYWREVELKIKIAKLQEGLADGMKYIEGAMKDVLTLNELYEQLKSKVSGFSEADMEAEETKTHLKRALVQCIRDVRQYGSITKGEQEYIEQIGVNPMKLQGLLKKYVEAEAKDEKWDVSGLYEFVDKLADELTDVYKVDQVRMQMQGFKPDTFLEYSYANKVALLPEEKSQGEQ